MVRVCSKIGVVALAMLFAVLPVMACAVRSAAMTPAERACCKKMAQQCGGADMAKSHPCCKPTATPADFQAVKTASFHADHFGLVLLHAFSLAAQGDISGLSGQDACSVSVTHSPPPLAVTTTTILRI